jgi:cytochrome c oxidase subunit 2
MMGRLGTPGAACLAILLGGCTAGPLSILDPAGPAGADIAHISRVMIVGFGIVWIGVLVLAAYALMARRRGEAPVRALVIGGGLVFPSVVVLALLVYGIQSGKRMLPTPAQEDVFRVEVTGHQWWWEVSHPEAREPARLVNEMHIPAGVPVDVHLSSQDVIHSFWAPRLGGKMDAIPGRVNVIRLQADKPGVYYGVCAEFCGDLHAHMHLEIHAHPPEALQQRLAQAARVNRYAVPEEPSVPAGRAARTAPDSEARP